MQLTSELSSKTDMCSPCDETCENRNLNVMTEDNGEDDDESLNL